MEFTDSRSQSQTHAPKISEVRIKDFENKIPKEESDRKATQFSTKTSRRQTFEHETEKKK